MLGAACGTSFEVEVASDAAERTPAPEMAGGGPPVEPTPRVEEEPPVEQVDGAETLTPTPLATPTAAPTPSVPLPYDEAIDVYFADVERFWTEALPETYSIEFEPVIRRVPYDPNDADTLPECQGEIGPRDLYFDNAFYCQPDDYIAWDDRGLFPDLYDDFGDFTVGLVIAHEYGHAVQARADQDGPTIFIELQADCFAGAWAGAVDRGEMAGVVIDPADLDAAVGGLLTFADPLGTPASDPGAHGSAFDRVNAFADGFENGTLECATYLDDPPTTTGLTVDFNDVNSGNLPLEDLLPLLVTDLTNYLESVGAARVPGFVPPGAPVEFGSLAGDPPACGDVSVRAADVISSAYWCAADDTVYLDRAELEDLWSEAGDFAPSYQVAHSYITAYALELNDQASGREAIVFADCLVGDWVRDVFDGEEGPPDSSGREHGLFLSAGDLDEGIVGLISVPSLGPSLGDPGDLGAFERVTAFGGGFFDGFDSCVSP